MATLADSASECVMRYPDWKLHLTYLERRSDRDLGNVMETALAGAIGDLRRRHPGGRIEESDGLTTLRHSLVKMGLDPVRVPPASELLIRRVLEQPSSANGCLAWQFLSILTLKSEAPWAVLEGGRISPPLVFRPGQEGETLAGEGEGGLACAGLPVLADELGVLASPWTLPDPEALIDCSDPVFVCFLPRDLYKSMEPMAHMGRVVWTTWAYQFLRQRSCGQGSSGDH